MFITDSPVVSKIDRQLLDFNKKYTSRINSLISSIIDYQKKSGYVNKEYTKELINLISIFCLGITTPNNISQKEYDKLAKCLACHKIDVNYFCNLFGINVIDVPSGVGKDKISEVTVYEKTITTYEQFDIHNLLTKNKQEFTCYN